MTVLLLVLPGAGATATKATLVAPYTGSYAVTSNTVSPLVGGRCNDATLLSGATWNSTTGTAGWGVTALSMVSKGCHVGYGTDHTRAGGRADVVIPIGSPPSNGTHTVAANWSFTYHTTWGISHGVCPRVVGTGYQYCAVTADWYFYSCSAKLIDTTNGHRVWSSFRACTFGSGASWTKDYSKTCYSWGCTTTVTNSSKGTPTGNVTATVPLVWYWNSTSMTAAHSYVLSFSFLWGEFTFAQCYPTICRMVASILLDTATPGLGMSLGSVTIR